MKNQFKIALLFLFILIVSNLYSQSSEANWVPTSKMYGSKIYIDAEGLEDYTRDDFWVWALQENDPPLELETIDKDIYKTKTYYLMNKKLKKYSIAQVIYYDEDGNVITSYNYKINFTIPKFKYNYPIFPNSDEEYIFQKCMEYFKPNETN